MKVKESEQADLKLNNQKTKIMVSRPITSWQIDGETMETVTDFIFLGFSGGSGGKELPAMQETWVLSVVWEDPLEEGIATHSSILAWRNPMDRGARARHDWVTKHRTQNTHLISQRTALCGTNLQTLDYQWQRFFIWPNLRHTPKPSPWPICALTSLWNLVLTRSLPSQLK